MPLFVPEPRPVRDIDHQLRQLAARRVTAGGIIGDALVMLADLDLEEDALLALRTAHSPRPA
jgi:hypothetical protein